MASCTAKETPKDTMVSMGQIAAGRDRDRLKSVLGSCVGVSLYQPRLKVGVFAHVVLPDSAGREGTPGKFADTAIPAMLKLLREMGAGSYGLIAKLAGGANMFGGTGPMQIGDANVEAVTRALKLAGIRVAAQEVGGTKGRRVVFDCSSGTMTVEGAGIPPKTL